MFTYNKKLQYTVRVDRPDPAFARKLQELIGGKYGEMSVMMQYLFQAWGQRGDREDPRVLQVKDMVLDTACEEIAHVEMVSTCVSMLLNGAEPMPTTAVSSGDGMVAAQLAGMNPQHMIVSGLGAQPVDSVGNPWNGAYITASGNVISDMNANATAEMNGRLQACRMYNLTEDSGVRDMLRFMIARDHMHQMQWLAVVEELGGTAAALPVPSTFPLDHELGQYAYAFMSYARQVDGTGSYALRLRRDTACYVIWASPRFDAGQKLVEYLEIPIRLLDMGRMRAVLEHYPFGTGNTIAQHFIEVRS